MQRTRQIKVVDGVCLEIVVKCRKVHYLKVLRRVLVNFKYNEFYRIFGA